MKSLEEAVQLADRELEVLLYDPTVSLPSYSLVSSDHCCPLHLNSVETILGPVASWGTYSNGRSICLTLSNATVLINVVYNILYVS